MDVTLACCGCAQVAMNGKNRAPSESSVGEARRGGRRANRADPNGAGAGVLPGARRAVRRATRRLFRPQPGDATRSESTKGGRGSRRAVCPRDSPGIAARPQPCPPESACRVRRAAARRSPSAGPSRRACGCSRPRRAFRRRLLWRLPSLAVIMITRIGTGRVRRSFSRTKKPLRLGIIMSYMPTRSGSARVWLSFKLWLNLQAFHFLHQEVHSERFADSCDAAVWVI